MFHQEEKLSDFEKKIVLVGNPNVGKSVLFGLFTGKYATVSNYPGTTVEVSRGVAWIRRKRCLVVDSPGVNSLVPTSEDEKVTRNILIEGDFDVVIQVVDSKNLWRGLFVTVQLVEMGLPVVIALNMYDEAGERGIRIDTERLSSIIGLRVVPTIATQRWNIERLKDAVLAETETPRDRGAGFRISYPEPIEQGINSLADVLPRMGIASRAISLMLLSGDRTIREYLSQRVEPGVLATIDRICGDVERRFSQSVGFIINHLRHKEVDGIIKRVVTRIEPSGSPVAEFIGRWSMHPVGGIPILVSVLLFMYWFVGVVGAGTVVDFLEEVIFGEYLNPWAQRMVAYLFAEGFVYDILVGPYGVVTMALTYSVAIILPIVGFFFIFFSILEDSGYLPRLAIMVDRIFKVMGLNGKAVLPMVLGLGCDTMATMTTRILETRKERVIVTFLLALGVPCSAQLGVILGMLGSVSLTASIVWGGVVIGVMLAVGFLASILIKGEPSDFILEIPPIRMPQPYNVVLKTLVRVEWYIKEAVPLFVAGTLFLFVLDRTGALQMLEAVAKPIVVGFLDLPGEATGAFIMGFLRRDYGAAGFFALQKAGRLDPVQVVVSLVTLTLFVPCIANFFMIIKERGLRTALWMAAVIFPLAVVVGGVLNGILRATGIGL